MRAAPIAYAFAAILALTLPASAGICLGTEQECEERRQQDQAALAEGLSMVIPFELDSVELSPEAQEKLSAFAAVLRNNRMREHNFVIEGHTDALGSRAYNEELSQRRARAVMEFLVASGLDNVRVEAQGLGMAAPRADDPYDPANRRVELRLRLP